MDTLTCVNGHHWHKSAADESDPVCPQCGATALVPVRDTTPDEVTEASPPQPVALPEPALAPGAMLAGYQIISTLGQGGMGIVYKATQLSLKRVVALKLMRGAGAPDDASFTRFQREAEAIARLQHPNIVQIYEVGRHDGRPFFSLEYVQGGTLAKHLKRNLPSLRQTAMLLETLARAVHHAHERGILHRDLKPGNILLSRDKASDAADDKAAPLAAMHLKITDFGLAKYVHEADTDEPLTQSGVAVGTPSYMAPEQATGQGHALGPGTDIYALGTILYEMLTGRPPFHGATPMHTMTQVVHDYPVSPSMLRPGLPRDLETICMTCLHKSPAGRYPTAEALANDLRAFLVGGSIQARSPGAGDRLQRWLRQHPALAALVGLGAAAGLGLLLSAFWFNMLAISVLAVLCILGGAAWYNARLQNALRESTAQHVRAERNAQRLFLLLETTQRLLTMRDAEQLLKLLSETTTRLLDAERATIFLVDRDKQELWSKVALGDDVGEIRVPLGQGIAGAAALSGETSLLADPYGDPRFNPAIDRRTGFTTRNLLTLPMVGENGTVVGVFQVLNKRGGTFGPEDAEILTPLAASAARAVELSQRPG
jgi:putative methionine-R-sulfoxide reductase with GAF domain